jgi:hypothetical protein
LQDGGYRSSSCGARATGSVQCKEYPFRTFPPISGVTDREFREVVLAWRDDIAKTTRREADNLTAAIAADSTPFYRRRSPEYNGGHATRIAPG